MSRPIARRPVYPSDFRRLFRAISRWAVYSSFGVAAACGSYKLNPDLGPNVPPDDNLVTGGNGGGSGGSGGVSGTSGEGGSGGAVLPTGGSGGRGGRGGAASGGSGGAPPTGGSGGSGPPPDLGWHAVPCNDLALNLFAHAKLAMPIDYAAVYGTWPRDGGPGFDGDGGVAEPFQQQMLVHGSPCTGAASPDVCMRSLQELVDVGGQRFLVVTAGDWVSRIEERAALAALLGSVDTEAEAAIVALLEGREVACWNGADLVDEELWGQGTRTRQTAAGYFEVRTHWDYCEGRGQGVTDKVFADASFDPGEIEDLNAGCVAGRRPAGLQACAAPAGFSEVGAYLAQAARLEAASVRAFEALALELSQLGAPAELIGAAVASALDEVEHARSVSELAQRFGALPLPLEIAPSQARGAFAIALENAVEGCVRETYGALAAWYQAEAARDAGIREAMQRIAEDETRHAELSWRIAAWLEPQLSDAERDAIAIARREAVVQLARELAPKMSAEAASLLGLPQAGVATQLLTQLDRALGLYA